MYLHLQCQELSRSLFVERAIRLLKMYCKYHFNLDEDKGYSVDEDGCTEIVVFEDLDKHENHCGKALVTCKYSAFCGLLRRNALEAHEIACIYRPDLCAHCQADIPFNDMEVCSLTFVVLVVNPPQRLIFPIVAWYL